MKTSDHAMLTARKTPNSGRLVRPKLRGSVLIWILGSMAVAMILTAVLVVDAFTLSREARVVRGAMFRVLDSRPSTKVQLSGGPIVLGSARFLLGFIDKLPAEARLALSSVRSASVGVYHVNGDVTRTRYNELLTASDEAMARQGWSRAVGVVQRDNCVLIYIPKGSADDGPVRVCVAVCHARELVIVSATARPAELLELASQHHGLASL